MRITLHTTRRCNLACTYCYADCTTGRPREQTDMSVETGRQAVDFGLARADEALQITFLGGEPALRLDLVEQVAHYAEQRARELGKAVTFDLTTNGTVCNDRFLALLRRFDFALAISIDGTPEVHDRHRRGVGGEGTWRLLDANLDRLLEAVPWAIGSAVVTPDTIGRLADSTKFILDRGFRIIVTSLDSSATWSPEHVRVMAREWKKLGKLYVRRSRRREKFYLSTLDAPMRTHVRDDRDCGDCDAGEGHLSVSEGGLLFPCVQFVSEDPASRWCVGDVRSGVDPARQAALLCAMRAPADDCRGCQLESRCASRCPCANLAATGDPSQPSPILCAAQRIAIPTADGVAARLFRQKNEAFLHKHYNRLYPVALSVEEALRVSQTQQEQCNAG